MRFYDKEADMGSVFIELIFNELNSFEYVLFIGWLALTAYAIGNGWLLIKSLVRRGRG
jgi:hypothetical protein